MRELELQSHKNELDVPFIAEKVSRAVQIEEGTQS